jgi:TolB-like protein/DNA-binding CsgD family transcriptional regulator
MEHDKRPTGLSDRERLVATKFAAGMTYREIGETLFIAPTTVRTHLSTIYRKLGVRSKFDLAKALAENDGANKLFAHVELQATASWPPIVAVIPFESLSTGDKWIRVADGLSGDIIVDLARSRDLAVLSRQTMFSYKGTHADARSIGRALNADYLIEGTLQARAERVRISVQLIDARTGLDLWTERYDRPVENLFAMLDSVTESVINILASADGKLGNLGRQAARRKPPASLQAYDFYLLGVEQKHLFTRQANTEAIRLLTRAVELDPDLARAWTVLGLAHVVDAMNGFTNDLSAAIGRGKSCFQRALTLDSDDTFARVVLAELRSREGEVDVVASEQERALVTAPHDSDTLALVAGSMALVAGDPNRGYELAKKAVRYNPNVPWYLGMLARCSFVVGRYRECVDALHHAAPDSPATLLFLAMAYAMLDETSRVETCKTRLADEFGDYTAETFIRAYPVTNPSALAAIRAGAQRSGIARPFR